MRDNALSALLFPVPPRVFPHWTFAAVWWTDADQRKSAADHGDPV